MEEALLLIEENQSWIYLVLVVAALAYLRLAVRHYRAFRTSYFGIEKESASSQFARASAMLGLIVSVLVATFLVATFAGPAVPVSSRPTPIPTVSLLTTSVGPTVSPIEASISATPVADVEANSAGCQNTQATLRSPVDNEAIRGTVEVLGAANIPNFAFFKIEYKGLEPDAVWRAVWAGTETVCESGCGESELLGRWDTSLVTPGRYAMRLVVTDASGNAPLPCMITVDILPAAP